MTRPNQDLMSVRFLGVGMSFMASRYFGSSATLVLEMRNPANSTSLAQNWNFSGFRTMPLLPTVSWNSRVHHQCYSRSVSQKMVSSMHLSFSRKSSRTASNLLL